MFPQRRHMCVSAQKDFTFGKGQRRILAVMMAVRGIYRLTAVGQHKIVRQDRKIQYHLVHLCITVSPDADVIFLFIQHGKDSLRAVFLRKIVSWAVIKKISQKNRLIRLFPALSLQQHPAVFRGSVNIRRNHPFHPACFLSFLFVRFVL